MKKTTSSTKTKTKTVGKVEADGQEVVIKTTELSPAHGRDDGSDLPQISKGVEQGFLSTTASGQPVSYLRMTREECPKCKGATGGSMMGVIKDLGQGSVALECSNLQCRHTMNWKDPGTRG